MIELKTEADIKQFFKDEALGFEILADGVSEYNTLVPILINGNYYNFKISFFTEDKPFACYDKLSGLLSDMQIFEVYAQDSRTNETTHHIYQNKYNG